MAKKRMSKDDKCKCVIKYYTDVKSTRQNWDAYWRELAHFFNPDKDDIYEFQTGAKGEEKYGRLYTTVPVHYNEMLATTLQGMLTSSSEIWFSFHHKDAEIDKKTAVRTWFQELGRRMIMYMNNSNFQPQNHETFMGLTTFGTAPLFIYEDDDQVFNFQSRPIFQWYIKQNSKGVIDSMSACDKLTAREILDRYGEEHFSEDELEKMHKEKSKKHEVIILVIPKKEAEKMGFSSELPFVTIHVLKEGKKVLKNKGFHEFPAVVPRFMKNADETYGRCPSMKALPDARMLNQIMKTLIRAAQKVVDPPLNVPDDSFLGALSLVPGALNPYKSGTDDRIYPIETRGDIRLGNDIVEAVKRDIRQHFFIDQLQLREGPQKTATEVNAIVEQQLRLLAPVLGRFVTEYLQPLTARCLGIMSRKKLLPPNPPPEIARKNLQIDVFFTSRIAKAQKSQEANDLLEFVGAIGNAGESFPEMRIMVDPSKAIKKFAKLKGGQEDILRTDKEVAEIRSAEQSARQEAARQQTQLNEAETISKALPPLQNAGAMNGQ